MTLWWKELKKKVKDYCQYLLFRFLRRTVLLLPQKRVFSFSRFLGNLLYRIGSFSYPVLETNLTLAFPEMSAQEKETLMRASFVNMASFVVSLLRCPDSERIRSLVHEKDLSSLREAIADNRGVIIVSGHYGNWEIGLVWLSLMLCKMTAVSRRLDNPYMEREISRFREQGGNKVLNKEPRVAVKIKRVLDAKGVVGLLMDQNQQRKEAIFVDFFGVPAATSPSAAYFSVKTGAPVIPVFCTPEANGFSLESLPPLEACEQGDEKARILDLTARICKALEERVRKEPQWYFWFHKRWKTRPPGEESLYKRRG